MTLAKLLLVVVSASLAYSTEAGCYRGRPKPVIPVEDYHWNDEPAPLLSSKHMPRRFDWSDVDGKNYLVPSWGQHQPIYCGSCWVHGTLSMVRAIAFRNTDDKELPPTTLTCAARLIVAFASSRGLQATASCLLCCCRSRTG